MRQKFYYSLLVLVSLGILFFLLRNQASPALAQPPVQLAWFYKPPRDGDLEPLRRHFDLFILTKTDEPVRDRLKVQGINGPFLQYLRFDVIHNPGSCQAQPRRNQVADRIGDYCWISQRHPDWFLLDENGQRMVAADGDVLMDPGHPEWRAFWLARARASQEQLGWDGIFLDNVEASLAKRQQRDQLPAAYPTGAEYQAAIEDFLQYIYLNYFRPQQRLLFANIISLEDEKVWFRYLRHLDGAMEEAFAVDWADGYLETGAWEQQLKRIERTQAMGKDIILVAQGESEADADRQVFAFASYLLANTGRASFRYGSDYHSAWLYDNYSLDLGRPLGPRYHEDGVWRRDFSRGQVQVDPAARTAEIVAD